MKSIHLLPVLFLSACVSAPPSADEKPMLITITRMHDASKFCKDAAWQQHLVIQNSKGETTGCLVFQETGCAIITGRTNTLLELETALKKCAVNMKKRDN